MINYLLTRNIKLKGGASYWLERQEKTDFSWGTKFNLDFITRITYIIINMNIDYVV